MVEVNDKGLVAKAKKGDLRAMEALYNKYVDRVYRFLYSRTESKEDAEDITAETFLAVVERIDRFENKSSFIHWVFSIAHNKLNDFLRTKYKMNQTELNEYVLPFTSELVSGTSQELLMSMWKIIEKLPEKYRRVLELRFKKRLSLKEVAKVLKLSESNVKVIQHRAIQKAEQIASNLND